MTAVSGARSSAGTRSSHQARLRIGQLLIMGIDGTEASERVRGLLARLQPGGVILFQRNIVAARQTWELLRACQAAVDNPMFLCVDMEGGTVDRLREAIAPVPSAAEVAATGDRKLFRAHGRLLGDEVRALGFNVNFAPVLDLGLAASRNVMGSRTVSADPAPVVVYAREFLRGLSEAGVLGCGKHFPGLGDAALDTHKELPEVPRGWKELWAEDLQPYRGLRRELPFVMVAHAAYPAVTKAKTPASVSRKWITEVLRRKIGYRGLIVSDDLEMGGLLAALPVEQAAVETIRAGADMFLVCHKEEHVAAAYEAVVREAERDRRFARRVMVAARRVATIKKKSGEPKRKVAAPSEKTVARLRQRTLAFAEQVRGAAVML